MPLEQEAAEQDFESAFAEFAGGEGAPPEPELPESETEQAEPETEQAESETGEPESETEEPAPPADDNDPIAQLQRERDEWRHRYQSDQGRVSALQRKINELERQQQQTRPAQQQSEEMPAAVKELIENYPEIADGVRALVEGERARILREVQGQVDPLRQAHLSRAQQEAQEREQRGVQAVEQAHPGWQEIVRTNDFQDWLYRQPAGIQALTKSDEPGDAIALLNLFKGVSLQGAVDSKAEDTSRADRIAAERKRKLEEAESIPSATVSKREEVSDDFDSAFAYYANRKGSR